MPSKRSASSITYHPNLMVKEVVRSDHLSTIRRITDTSTRGKLKRSGTLTATARPLHRGRSLHVYAVDVTDEAGDLVSACRCTIAVRPRKAGS